MPKKNLTDLTIKNLKLKPTGPYNVMDGSPETPRGFGIRIQGSKQKPIKTFILYTRFPNSTKPARRAIGQYGEITLEAARKVAVSWRQLIKEGKDPRAEAERKAAEERAKKIEEKPIEELCRSFIQKYAKIHTKARSWRETARYLGLEPDPDNEGELRFTKSKGEVISKWEGRSIQSITPAEVIDLIDSIFARGAKIAANRTLAAIRKMFAWAVSRKLLTVSPCQEVKPPAKERKRRRVLLQLLEEAPDDMPDYSAEDHPELRAVWRAAEYLDEPAPDGYRPRRDAYRMLILSGQRKSIVRLARIEDFDLKRRLWIIEAEQEGVKRDEDDIPHVIPITAEIEAIVRSCPHKAGYLFSLDGGKTPLTIGGKLKKELDGLVLQELRREASERGDDPASVQLKHWTNHDLRRSMRSGISSLAVPEGDTVRELLIGHKQKGIKEVYDLHKYLRPMRIALELWAAKVRSIVEPAANNVVRLHVHQQG